MSKIFKSIVSNREVRIWPTSAGFAVAVLDDGLNESMSTQLAPADAPAICLAILEAAGIVPAYHSDYQNGTPEALEHVAQGLKDEIDIAEAAAKEAADREALEGEALELLNGFRAAAGHPPHKRLSDTGDVVERWRAVARTARTLHGGAK